MLRPFPISHFPELLRRCAGQRHAAEATFEENFVAILVAPLLVCGKLDHALVGCFALCLGEVPSLSRRGTLLFQ